MDKDKKPGKSNALRLLEQAHIPYEAVYYELSAAEFSGEAASRQLGLEPERVFKTLCARGTDQQISVFVIPTNASLDLKKAAQQAGEKKLELAPVKELRALTGYERGSVSPIGLKKPYPVYIDETALLFDTIAVSGGAKGCSVLVQPETLAAWLPAELVDLC